MTTYSPRLPMDGYIECLPHGEANSAEAKISEIEAQLLLIERRLGTPEERPNDLQEARDLAHDISNIRMRLSLLRELARHKKLSAKRCGP